MVSLVVHHPRFLTGRNRCRVKIMLSGRSWDDWGLMAVTPSRPLQADNWPRQAWGSLSTWPRQSRWWQLSRSLAISEEKLSVGDAVFGKIWGVIFFVEGKNECRSSGSTATLFIYPHDETLHGRAFSLLPGDEEPFVWWRHLVTASELSVVTQRETVCVASGEHSTVFLEEPGTPIMELLWNSRVQGWCGHWKRKQSTSLYNLKSASGSLRPHSLPNQADKVFPLPAIGALTLWVKTSQLQESPPL